jgi:hypothetical protein
VKLLVGALAVFTACNSCTPAPAPIDAGPPVPPTGTTGEVYSKLVEAGCLQADDASDGYAAIYEEHVSDEQPQWLACLYLGGSVGSCLVPCGGGE